MSHAINGTYLYLKSTHGNTDIKKYWLFIHKLNLIDHLVFSDNPSCGKPLHAPPLQSDFILWQLKGLTLSKDLRHAASDRRKKLSVGNSWHFK